MRAWLLALAVAGALGLVTAGRSWAADSALASSKIPESLRLRWASGERADVLIRLRTTPLAAKRGLAFSTQSRLAVDALKAQADASQKPLIDWLRSQSIAARPFWIANVIAARLDADAAVALAARDEVIGFEWDATFKAEIGREEGPAEAIRAVESMWPRACARGVGHGLPWRRRGDCGTGYGLPMGSSGAESQLSWLGWCDRRSQLPLARCDQRRHRRQQQSLWLECGGACDDSSHGTHTMGTMSGDDGASNQIGVAPGARWIGCRNMDSGTGRPSTYLDCFQWFAAPTDLNGLNPDPARAPHVIGNSWGCPVGPPPAGEDCALASFATAISNLKAQGILIVVAAGNSGSSCATVVDPPAIYADAFTIGATDNSDVIAPFSSRGPVTVDGSNRLKPDVVAPGVGVRSAVPGGAYGSKSGTSMATPNAVGVAALVMSANPALRGQPEQVEAILRETAVPLTSATSCGGMPGSQVPNPIYGHGRLDALAAVQRALQIDGVFSDGFEQN